MAVSAQSVDKQLKRIKFNAKGWGRTEARELPHILLENEEIYEAVNGIYEGGFALLVGTDVRVLLIDKKPLNYLTVEDLRFDMINELDYNHRLVGAHISISAGSKYLKFTSYNQQKLRKLIGHVQQCMAEMKKKQSAHQEDQRTHLEQINQQLQAYLIAQHQQQQQLQQRLEESKNQSITPPEPVKPSPELTDYLFAQSLLAQYKAQNPQSGVQPQFVPEAILPSQPTAEPVRSTFQLPAQSTETSGIRTASLETPGAQLADLYAEGMQEIFGTRPQSSPAVPTQSEPSTSTPTPQPAAYNLLNPLEINPLRIAYSKLPMALRNRKFGRPSFHAHSQQEQPSGPAPAQPQPAGAQ